jgi:ABC-type sugar transport systems, permease components
MRSSKISLPEIAMLAPALILLMVFLVIPFVMSINLAFTNQPLIQGPIPTKFIGLKNFQRILTDPSFWKAFSNVLIFAASVIPVQCGFALWSAILINGQKTAKRFFQGVFFLPYITPMVVVCVIWSTLFQYPTGLINSVLSHVSFGLIKPIEWLSNPKTAMIGIVMLSAWQSFGFQMIIYMAGLQNISSELYEAASIDGASGLQRFSKVTWPCLYETNVFVLTITTIQALQLFTQVNILTQGGPQDSTNTIVHYVFRTGFVIQNIGKASAGSLILFVLIVSIYGGLSFLTRRDPKEA